MRPAALLAALVLVPGGGGAAAQALVVDDAAIPGGPGIPDSYSENADFGDLDLDGDWDAAIADGGDWGNDQNRLWINQGGLQRGELGLFLDETAARAPAVLDDSRDVELADLDGDADLDLAAANTAQITPQGSRLWINRGGLQGGDLGYYADETAARFLGLGLPGSSIAPSQVLAAGNWIDWCDEIDFGDLDADGDLDLVHASAGVTYGGNSPTRLFLNDGAGFFSELNPSGYQLASSTLPPGAPGLWCEGTNESQTMDTTGLFCDITTSCRDVDVADLDGDFDLDLVQNKQGGWSRAFANRLDGSALAPASTAGLVFRDVTGAAWPGLPAANSAFEQELGDLDRDGDLDLYGVNWSPQSGLTTLDQVLENRGDGTFKPPLVVPETGFNVDADFLDYDSDGDLDVYVASFSGQNRLLRNDGGTFGSLTSVAIELFAGTCFDADAVDTDGDGDPDVLVAEAYNQANTFLRNVVDVPDVHAPYLPRVEALPDHVAGAEPRTVRAQVYDNAAEYVTWHADVALEVSVDGVALPARAARSSGGQVFRAELPGNLVGSVVYRFTAADERGNTGASAQQGFTGATALAFASSYGAATAGLAAGAPPALRALSVPFGGTQLVLAGHSGAPAGTPVLLAVSLQKADPPLLAAGVVLSNVALPPLFVAPAATDAAGDAVFALAVPAGAGGVQVFLQLAALDPTASGELLSASLGLEITLP